MNFFIQAFHGKTFGVKGYEIHMGETASDLDFEALITSSDRMDGCKSADEQVIGTYFHGIFHNDAFRENILNVIREKKGLAPIYNRVSFNQLREEAFDRLADHVRKNVKFDVIQQKMEEFQLRRITL
jgi:adenosylcobyric acid synthase